jgi:hypothetical protein
MATELDITPEKVWRSNTMPGSPSRWTKPSATRATPSSATSAVCVQGAAGRGALVAHQVTAPSGARVGSSRIVKTRKPFNRSSQPGVSPLRFAAKSLLTAVLQTGVLDRFCAVRYDPRHR